ncbi:signal peptidase, partial [Leucosporidium creatinivorum]
LRALGWIPVAVFFNDHVLSLATVKGRSMQPTLNPDSSHMIQDIVLLNRYAAVESASGTGQGGFKVGDIVALKSPTDPKQLLIKRIIGLPGSIVTTLPPHPHRSVRIPAGHCWVEGDERYHSRDSNAYGPIPLGLVNARVVGVLWPPR